MNNKIISLEERRKQKINDSIQKPGQPTGEVVKLWRLSLAMDDLVRSGVLEDKIPVDEIAVIFANRLGTLINCSENSVELAKFCNEIIERINCEGKKGA